MRSHPLYYPTTFRYPVRGTRRMGDWSSFADCIKKCYREKTPECPPCNDPGHEYVVHPRTGMPMQEGKFPLPDEFLPPGFHGNQSPPGGPGGGHEPFPPGGIPPGICITPESCVPGNLPPGRGATTEPAPRFYDGPQTYTEHAPPPFVAPPRKMTPYKKSLMFISCSPFVIINTFFT